MTRDYIHIFKALRLIHLYLKYKASSNAEILTTSYWCETGQVPKRYSQWSLSKRLGGTVLVLCTIHLYVLSHL